MSSAIGIPVRNSGVDIDSLAKLINFAWQGPWFEHLRAFHLVFPGGEWLACSMAGPWGVVLEARLGCMSAARFEAG